MLDISCRVHAVRKNQEKTVFQGSKTLSVNVMKSQKILLKLEESQEKSVSFIS